jgi:cytochrome o ubiquinol oxidase subunit 2
LSRGLFRRASPLLALALSACGPLSFLDPYGQVAATQRHLFFVIILCMAVVVVPVFLLTPLFAWRYRRAAYRPASYRPNWDFSWTLEAFIWGVPVAVVAVLAWFEWSVEPRLDPYSSIRSATPPLQIQAIGLDWKWLFIYPAQHIATVGELALPLDRPVHVSITSDTVMQSLFIPALAGQIYAMAGMVTQLNLIANRQGVIRGENTQYNGVGFQYQKFSVPILKQADFQSWVATVRADAIKLDANSFKRLAETGSPGQARAELGTGKMPATALYYDLATPNLFNAVVDRFRTLSSAPRGAGDAVK